MYNMQLIRPSLQYKNQFLEAVKEHDESIGDTCLVPPAEGQSFEEFIKQYDDREKGANLPPGYVRETMFWLIDNDEFIGRVSVRHELNENLKQVGGHIGYYIRPSQRNKGYGKKILALGLQEAKKIWPI